MQTIGPGSAVEITQEEPQLTPVRRAEFRQHTPRPDWRGRYAWGLYLIDYAVGLVAAGPILAALAGAGTGGVAGGLVGGLVGLGIPEHAAKVMEQQVSRGGILIAVDLASPDERKLADQVFEQTGATSTSRV